MRRQTVAQWVSLVVLLASLLVVDATAAPVDPIAESQGFRKAVTVAGIREHQLAFQQIADANGGTSGGLRRATTPPWRTS